MQLICPSFVVSPKWWQQVQDYTFNNSTAVPKILEIKSAPIIIIEGLFILHFQFIAAMQDRKIFIESKKEIALQHRSNSMIECGYPYEDINYKCEINRAGSIDFDR